MKIAIAGAGLGGLTAAACLSKAGHEVSVFEQREGLSAQGGIIGLRPSALKILYGLSLQSEIDAVSSSYGETQFRVLLNAKVVRTVELHREQSGDEGLSRIIRRPELAEVLYKASTQAGATIKFNAGVRSFQEDSESVKLQLEDGTTQSADLVLAADGIRSRLRSDILADLAPHLREPILTEATFYVFRVDATRLPSDVKSRMFESSGPWVRMTAWRGQDSWAMSAFDTGLQVIDLGLTIVEPIDQSSLWDEQGDVAKVQEHFKSRACGDILASLAASDTCDRWRLAYIPSLPRWRSAGPGAQGGRVALLGDAAHAILPNGGAGISLTIEDVGALSHLLSRQSDAVSDVPRLLKIWEQACKPRADRLREFGVFNMSVLAGDAAATAESASGLQEEQSKGGPPVANVNASFSTLSFAKWLSGYDPIAAVEARVADH